MSGDELNAKGTWRQVVAVIDGKNVPVGPGVLLTVAADGYTVTVNGKVYQRGTAKTNYDTTPRQSDVIVAEGPHAGQTVPQIFTIEGDVLIACNAPPGAARPTAFTSVPDSGHTLSIWLKTTEAASARPAPRTWRTWLVMAVLFVAAGGVGGMSEGLGPSLGHWVGVLAGGLAGTLIVTALGLWLRWDWQTAIATGVAVSVAWTTFDGLRPALAPTLGALGAVFVSGSTAIVAAFFAGAVLSWLLKIRR